MKSEVCRIPNIAIQRHKSVGDFSFWLKKKKRLRTTSLFQSTSDSGQHQLCRSSRSNFDPGPTIPGDFAGVGGSNLAQSLRGLDSVPVPTADLDGALAGGLLAPRRAGLHGCVGPTPDREKTVNGCCTAASHIRGARIAFIAPTDTIVLGIQ